MIKYNLSNISLIFLVRLDTVERIENLFAVINFLKQNLETNFMILECAPYNNGILERLLIKLFDILFKKILILFFTGQNI